MGQPGEGDGTIRPDNGANSANAKGVDPQGTLTLARLTGDEVAPHGLPTKEAVKAARTWFDEHLKPLTVQSQALGQPVGFNTSGRNKSTSFAGDRRKLYLLPALPGIIGNGRLERSEPPADASNRSVRSFQIFEGEVDLAGEITPVRVVVRETVNGHFHYDHYVPDDPATPGARAGPETNRGGGSPGGGT
jgi:hypothetical protein